VKCGASAVLGGANIDIYIFFVQLIWILHLHGRDNANMTSGEAISPSSCSSTRTRTTVVCVSVVAALVLGIGILSALAAGPLHAQCAVEWYGTAVMQLGTDTENHHSFFTLISACVLLLTPDFYKHSRYLNSYIEFFFLNYLCMKCLLNKLFLHI